MKAKLFFYYLFIGFASASLAYSALSLISTRPVFGALYRMFGFHHDHPYQYIGIACFSFAIVAAEFSRKIAHFEGAKRGAAIFALMLGSIVLASFFGGALWSIHDMQAGYFPPFERLWRAVVHYSIEGLILGWLIIAISFPYNCIGLLIGYFITSYGLRLSTKVAQPSAPLNSYGRRRLPSL